MSDAGAKLYDRKVQGVKPLTFKVDCHALKSWIDKRVGSLKNIRAEFEPIWKDIRTYFEPNIGKALLDGDRDQTASKRDDKRLLSSYPRKTAHQYAAGMQSGITNQAQQWVEFIPKTNEDSVKERPDLKRWFDFVTKQVLRAMQRGNIYQTTDQVYLHSGVFGTSCAILLKGDQSGEVFLHLLDEGDYWIAEDRFQMVNTCLRRMEMTIAQAAEEFLVSGIPESWAHKLEEGQAETRVTVWNLICPNETGNELFKDIPSDRKMASFYFAEGQDHTDNCGILAIRSFSYNPIIAYRHMHCGSVYGKGLGEMALGDVKELQKLEEYKLRMIANEVNPAMIAPSSMKGLPINIYPGGITYVDQLGPNPSAPIQRLFQTRESIEALAAQIGIIEQRIGRIFYAELFSMMLNINAASNKQMTAREISELSGEKVTLLGPVLTRMNHDFLTPLTDGIFSILYADGLLEDETHLIPDEVRDGPNGEPPQVGISTEFVSTIHTEMMANIRMRGILKMLDISGMVAQAIPTTLDKLNGDQVIDEVGDIYRSTASFVRSDKEVAQLRAQRAEEQQDAERKAMLAEMSKNAGTQAKALSDAHIGNGNALEALMQGGYQ